MEYDADGSSSRVAEAPTVIEQDADDASRRVPSFMIELADFLLRVSKEKEKRIATEKVDLLADT